MHMQTRLGALALVLTASAPAMATEVFFTNFNSGLPAQISGGGTVESVQGFAGFGNPGNQFGGNFLRNATNSPIVATTLTLNNLPAHDSLSIRFLLAVIDSWDSDNGNPAPDLFQVRVDGTLVLSVTAANQSGSNTYAGNQIAPLAAYGFGPFNDRAFDMSTEAALNNIPHTASSVTIEFTAAGAGWQGGLDESWAIDNLGVSVVPAPGAAGVLALGALGVARRRR